MPRPNVKLNNHVFVIAAPHSTPRETQGLFARNAQIVVDNEGANPSKRPADGRRIRPRHKWGKQRRERRQERSGPANAPRCYGAKVNAF
jgi:hypothetical protein